MNGQGSKSQCHTAHLRSEEKANDQLCQVEGVGCLVTHFAGPNQVSLAMQLEGLVMIDSRQTNESLVIDVDVVQAHATVLN